MDAADRARFIRGQQTALPVADDPDRPALPLDAWSCAGAGALPTGAAERRARGGPMGRCAHCGARVILNGTGTVAEHRDTRTGA